MSTTTIAIALVVVFVVAGVWVAVRRHQTNGTASKPVGESAAHTIEVKLASGWALTVPDTFRQSDAGTGSVQITDGLRTIYFSSMAVSKEGTPSSAEALHEASPARQGAKYEFREAGHFGYAHLTNKSNVLNLNATRESSGSVGIFVATFSRVEDEAWAVATWKSIREPEPTQREASSR
jgi:hypothetical protein